MDWAGRSKSGEVLLTELLLLAWTTFVLAAFFLSLRLLIEESKIFQVLVETHSAGCEFYHILAVTLTELLVLLGLEDCQFLLLDPLGIELSLLGNSLLLVYVGHLNALTLVVLLQS